MPSGHLGLANGWSIGRLSILPMDQPTGSPTGSITRPMAGASVKRTSSQQTLRWGWHWVRLWHTANAIDLNLNFKLKSLLSRSPG